MRQDSRVEPPTQLPQSGTLHPILGTALANLEIQLEDELARYRRQRVNAGRTPRQPGRKQPSPTLGLIAVSATGGRTNADGRTNPSPEQTFDRQVAPERRPEPVPQEQIAAVSEQTIAAEAYKPTPAFTANPQPFNSAIALRNGNESLAHDDSAINQLSAPTDSGDRSLVQTGKPNLDDYLESSEELLRSLADEEAEVRAERGFMQNLLTPLGLGSMLLLLLSSAMFGYVIMNPASLGPLIAWRSGTKSVGNVQSGQNAGQTVLPAPQPNLATQEFKDLNLNTLGTLNANPSASTSPVPGTKVTVTPASKPATAQPSVAKATGDAPTLGAATQAPIPAVTSSSSANRSSPVKTYEAPRTVAPNQVTPPLSRPTPTRTSPPRLAPTRTYSSPLPAAPTRNTAPASTAQTSPNGSYPVKVVTPYDGDSALTQSRAVVPDAYLRNFPDGAKIQLGAYGDTASAEAKAQELRRQGIPAEVYKP